VSLDASNKKRHQTFSSRCGVLFAKLLCSRQKYRLFPYLVKHPTYSVAMLKEVGDKFVLQNKIVLYADNTNTSFGGCKRLGKNNMWRKLESELKRQIFGIGCGAHYTQLSPVFCRLFVN
jgi:hypothetical protein